MCHAIIVILLKSSFTSLLMSLFIVFNRFTVASFSGLKKGIFLKMIAGTAASHNCLTQSVMINKRSAFQGIFCVFGSYFRTLVVILVSDFVSFLRLQSLIASGLLCVMPSSRDHSPQPPGYGHRSSFTSPFSLI